MKRSTLFSALFLFFVISIIVRIPYYLDYPVPGITNDSFTYSSASQYILNGSVPKFKSGTPGYPLFIASTYLLGLQKLNDLYKVQYVISLLTSCFVLYFAFKSIKNKIFFWVVFTAFAIYFNSPIAFSQETTLNPIALFANFYVLSLCLCLRVFFNRNSRSWEYLLLSFSIGILISLRPQIIALSVPFAILFVKLVYDKRHKASLELVSLPILTFLSIGIYNYATIGRFFYTDQLFHQKLISSVLYLEKNASQPKYINDAIDSVKITLREQFPNHNLEEVVTKNYADMDFFSGYFVSVIVRSSLEKALSSKQQQEIIQACGNRNFKLYFKKVVNTTKYCIILFSMKKEFYLTEVKNRVRYISDKRQYRNSDEELKRLVTRDYYDYFYLNKDIASVVGEYKEIYKPVFIVSTLYSRVFQPALFLPVYFICILFFIYKAIGDLFANKFPMSNIFWCAILFTPVANALVIGLYVIPYQHYNYPSDIIILFSPVLLFTILFKESKTLFNF